MGYDYQLQGSVGAGGKNKYTDSVVVQFLLNEERNIRGFSPIVLDGDIGGETVGAIREFQKLSFGTADGRIDPNGRSYRRLVTLHNAKPDPRSTSAKTYQSGYRNRYFVTVSNDGRIFVNTGDTLSRYSAAIYKDYFRFGEFGRIKNNALIPIVNPNLIVAGEILYHIPTYRKFMEDKIKVPPPPAPVPIPRHIIDEGLKKIATDDFKLKGDYGLKFVDTINDIVGYGGNIVDILSVAVPALENLGEALGIIGIPLGVYGNIRDFLNVSDTDVRMYGIRAACYAITAWTFDEPIPNGSAQILRNFAQSPTTPPKNKLDEIWKNSSQAAVASQTAQAERTIPSSPAISSNKMKHDIWKAHLKASHSSNIVLCKFFMNEIGEQALKDATPQVKNIWKYSIDDVIYPR